VDVKDFLLISLVSAGGWCIRLFPRFSRTGLSQYWARLSPTQGMLLFAVDKFWIQCLLLINAWIVKFDRGNLGCCVSWIWKRHMFMLIGTSCSSILVNGTPSGFFNSTRGLQQGDPFSPLLFTVVMEALNRMLIAAMDQGNLTGFTMGPRDSYALVVNH